MGHIWKQLIELVLSMLVKYFPHANNALDAVMCTHYVVLYDMDFGQPENMSIPIYEKCHLFVQFT